MKTLKIVRKETYPFGHGNYGLVAHSKDYSINIYLNNDPNNHICLDDLDSYLSDFAKELTEKGYKLSKSTLKKLKSINQ